MKIGVLRYDIVLFHHRRISVTSKPPAEIQTLIDTHISGFNTQNNDLFLSVFGETAVIIDGIAPYRWLNPNAPTNWLADVGEWRENVGVSSEHRPLTWASEMSRARPHMLIRDSHNND
jgi:hypothetical protein